MLLVLAIAGAPVVAEVCQMTCAAPAEHAGMPHAATDHATHESGDTCHVAATTSEPLIAAIPHACAHDGEGQPPAAGIGATQNGAAPPSLALVSARPAALDGFASQVFDWSRLSRSMTRPSSVPSLMPLRI
jgi:hypothetical protein